MQEESYATPSAKRKSTAEPIHPLGAEPCQSGCMGESPAQASDALFGLLIPLWQLIIGLLVVVAVVVSVHRLFMRGPSRMGGAMLLAGGAVVCVAVVSYVVQQI